MGLETATWIDELDPTNPTPTDPKSQGDDHLRLTKSVLQNQFPSLGQSAVTRTAEQLNTVGAGNVVQVKSGSFNGYAAGTVFIPVDDTKPQSNEGSQVMFLGFTPKYASSSLRIEVSGFFTVNSGLRWAVIALFRDAEADAIATTGRYEVTSNAGGTLTMSVEIPANSVAETSFSVRAGLNPGTAGAVEMNGSTGARYWGDSSASSITITEIAQ